VSIIAERSRADKRVELVRGSIFGFWFCYDTKFQLRTGPETLPRIPYEAAYPRIEILPSSRNWWSRLKGTAAECIHLNSESPWIATLLPDTLYIRGKRAKRREPVRPEVSLCRECLLDTIGEELEAFEGRVVAFEPDAALLTQYFFVASPDFEAVGLAPETASAIKKRLAKTDESCAECSREASWLWLSQEQVPSLDEVDKICDSPGEWFCAVHGARKLASAFEKIAEANVFYMNLPYGESGTYVWI